MKAPQITLRKAAELKPYASNARTHSETQINQLVASLLEFGFTNSVLGDAEGIVAGHGRVLAALKIYADGGTIAFPNGDPIPKGMVPFLDVTGWTPEQRKAYVLADNALALNAGWDEELLAAELAQLRTMDFDLGLIGFDDRELTRLLNGGKGATDPEVVPPEPENPVSRIDDIWIMGNHRIACGSSTDPEVVAAVLAGATPHLLVTDPPYGVEYDANWRNEAARTSSSGMGNRALGAGAVGKVLNDDRADWSEAWALFRGDVAYVWHAGAHATEVDLSLQATGFEIRSQIIWAKQQFAIGRGDYHWQHEPCWYAVRKGKKGHYVGGRKQTTVWNIDKPQSSETGHSTQKPIECMKRPIENNSKPGDAVYEPFSGSGTTIISCEMTDRHCYAIELNEAYVDIAVTRWQDFTNREAVLEATGQTFAEVEAERIGQVPPLETT